MPPRRNATHPLLSLPSNLHFALLALLGPIHPQNQNLFCIRAILDLASLCLRALWLNCAFSAQNTPTITASETIEANTLKTIAPDANVSSPFSSTTIV